MKKTISGVLLALTAVFTLVACGKKKTTTAEKSEGTTATKKKTTKLTSKEAIAKTNKLNFYCWNTEFKERLDKFYSGTNYYDATTTYLVGGTYIEWTVNANEGSNYQTKLDQNLAAGNVDMFLFEADYASKYVYGSMGQYSADLKSIEGFDNSAQYKYTNDIVTVTEGEGDSATTKVKGTSWQACPGVTIVNMNVANALWGTWEKNAKDEDVLKTPVTLEAVAAKVGPASATATKAQNKAHFAETCEDIKSKKKNKFAMIGPDDWYRVYSQNIAEKMWDGTNITVAPELFEWVNDTMDAFQKRYIRSVDDDYALWGAEWGAEQGKDNCLCIFSVPWFTDFCLKGYRFNKGEDEYAIKEMSDVKLKVCASHLGWFWGGTWLTATPAGLAKDSIKGDIANIIKKMGTDKDTLVAIAKGTGDFTNSKAAMEELAVSDDMKLNYFGGQNAFAIYAESIKGADLSKASDYDQPINEAMQASFRQYFQGYMTAAEAWADFKKECNKKSNIAQDNIKLPGGADVTIDDLVH